MKKKIDPLSIIGIGVQLQTTIEQQYAQRIHIIYYIIPTRNREIH